MRWLLFFSWLLLAPGVMASSAPPLSASSIYVWDLDTGKTLYARNANEALPIASITKLMAAMVLLDAKLDMQAQIRITDADVDRLKHSSSRLKVGTVLTRDQLLKLSLMSSENRAAHALARTYPGGVSAFVKAMNVKARQLGLERARFADPTGLSPRNTASAADLAKMTAAASEYAKIRRYSTATETAVQVKGVGATKYRNSNALVRNSAWPIVVSKTGYIREAGRCLVMTARVGARHLVFVLLDAKSSQDRTKDALALKRWLAPQLPRLLAAKA